MFLATLPATSYIFSVSLKLCFGADKADHDPFPPDLLLTIAEDLTPVLHRAVVFRSPVQNGTRRQTSPGLVQLFPTRCSVYRMPPVGDIEVWRDVEGRGDASVCHLAHRFRVDADELRTTSGETCEVWSVFSCLSANPARCDAFTVKAY